MMLLEYVDDCFRNDKGSNLTIDWPMTFRVMNNEINCKCNITNLEDTTTRCFRIKIF